MVKKKTKFDDAMAEMEERICRQFCTHGRPQCGIVYCLSRNDCEKVAAELGRRLAARLGRPPPPPYPRQVDARPSRVLLSAETCRQGSSHPLSSLSASA